MTTPHYPPDAVKTLRIRVKKEESAYVYAILESYDGLTSYSTLDAPMGAPYRDLELTIPMSRLEEVQAVLKQLGDLVYEI